MSGDMPDEAPRDEYGEVEEGQDDESYESYEEAGENADVTETAELSVAEAAEAALDEITGLTGKDAEGVTSVARSAGGWTVEVEVLEAHRVPSSSDTLALYEVEIGRTGALASYRRLRRYPRGRTDDAGGH